MLPLPGACGPAVPVVASRRRAAGRARGRATAPVVPECSAAYGSDGRYTTPSLFSTSQLLDTASQLAKAGRVDEAAAVLRRVPAYTVRTGAGSPSAPPSRGHTGGGTSTLDWSPYNTDAAAAARQEEQARIAVLTAQASAAQQAALAAGVPPGDGASPPSQQQLAWLSIPAGVRAALAPVAARARAGVPPSRRRGVMHGALADEITDVAGMVTFLSDLPVREAARLEASLAASLMQRRGAAAAAAANAGDAVTDADTLALQTGVAWVRALAGDFATSYSLLADALAALPRGEGSHADRVLLTMYCAKMAQAKGDLGQAEGHWGSVLDQAGDMFGVTTPNDVALEATKALAVLAAAQGRDDQVRRWTAQATAETRGLGQRRREPLHLRLARQSGPDDAGLRLYQ